MDVPAVETTELADSDAGRIEQRDLSFVLDICNGINDCIHLCHGGDDRKSRVITQEWNFIFVPVPFQDIVKEMMELGDMDIDGTIPDFPYCTEVIDIGADFFPGNILNSLAEKLGFNPFDELDEIADISYDGSLRKVAEREDFFLF